MKFKNMLELNVDDEELLIIPPFLHGSSYVLNTRNTGALYYMKMFRELFWNWLIEGDENPHPSPPDQKRENTN